MPALIVHEGGIARLLAEIARQAVDDVKTLRGHGLIEGETVVSSKWPRGRRGYPVNVCGMYGPCEGKTACDFFRCGHFRRLAQIGNIKVNPDAALSRLGLTEAR